VARKGSKHVKEFGWSHLHFKDFSSAELFCSMIRKEGKKLWIHASNESIRRQYTEHSKHYKNILLDQEGKEDGDVCGESCSGGQFRKNIARQT
jgi:hypothetical protein